MAKGFDYEDFGEFLLGQGLHEDVVSAIISNRICSEAFVDLMESDLKDLTPTIGDRICLRNLVAEAQKVYLICIIHDNEVGLM